MHDKVSAPLGVRELVFLLEAYFDDLWHEHRKTLLRLWGTAPAPKSAAPVATLRLLEKLSATELTRRLIDCALVGELKSSQWAQVSPKRLLRLATRHKINLKAVRSESDAALKKAEPKKATPTTGKAH